MLTERKIIFILVEPLTPENIGAAARAIKTMGFYELRIVNSCKHQDRRAHYLAHGSEDVLMATQVFKTLDDAISDLDLTIGTTAKSRNAYKQPQAIEDLPQLIINGESAFKKIGVVFGRESTGLSREDISQCDVMSYIPMAQNFPAINLSQAVMLYAYELGKGLKNLKLKTNPTKTISDVEASFLKSHVQDFLKRVKIDDGGRTSNKIYDRIASMKYQDMQLLHYVLNKTVKRFDIPS